MINMDDTDKEDRGQVGIGTLIVFIALVLVAAIAAGVLINTAGFLQSQAEATGEESTSQVSDNIDVISSFGTVNGAKQIGDLQFAVTKAPGSDTVDLEQLTLQITGPGGSAVVEAADDPSAPSSSSLDYGLSEVQAEQAGENILSDDSDQYIIQVGLGADSTDGTLGSGGGYTALSPGDEATITITTAQGSQRTVVLTVPEEVSTASQGNQFDL
jgi:flagellin FlaB